MFKFIINKIQNFVVRKATAHKMIDIVEVRTKELGLTSVKTETDIRIHNSFFLSIKVLSIHTDLLNRDGIKIGRMSYTQPVKIKGKTDAILTTNSEISIITSLFQMITSFLSQPIRMQSVGVAQIKFLWWVFEIPVDDYFEILPSKLKILKEETQEERKVRLENEAKIRAEISEKKADRKTNYFTRRADRKERHLRRIYKENYIPKEIRRQQEEPEEKDITEDDTSATITTTEGALQIEIDQDAVLQANNVESTEEVPENTISPEQKSPEESNPMDDKENIEE